MRRLLPSFVPVAVVLFGSLAMLASSSTPKAHAATSDGSPIINCKAATPCVKVRNLGRGIAVSGFAQNETAIDGTTPAVNTPSNIVNGIFVPTTGGVVGNDVATDLATDNNSGVLGFSKVATGVTGATENPAPCVCGTDISSLGFSSSGLFGGDAGPLSGFAGGITNAGVIGQSITRVGGVFLSRSGYGAVGRTFSGTGVLGVSRAAGGVALAAKSLQGGPVFKGFNATKEVASLDSNGNLTIAGTIRSLSTPSYVVPSVGGNNVIMYGPRQSIATVEDFGEAQLHVGNALVRISPAFAQLMDHGANYMVFITAEGDNRGLYVSSKTYSEFSVRESQNGRSNLAFSYRIVAQARDAHDEHVSAAPAPAPAPAPATERTSAVRSSVSGSAPASRHFSE